MLKKFENTALFQPLGLPSTLSRHSNRALGNAVQTLLI